MLLVFNWGSHQSHPNELWFQISGIHERPPIYLPLEIAHWKFTGRHGYSGSNGTRTTFYYDAPGWTPAQAQAWHDVLRLSS